MNSLTRSLTASQWEMLAREWSFWARGAQLPPEGDWRTWLFLGGRGAGKTRAGAQWVNGLARSGAAGRIALVGPTFHDVREVLIEGVSGLRALDGARPIYEPSRRRLLWLNGAQAYAFSAEDPESLRGPQFDAAWCDELCYWARPDEALETLSYGLRLGARPRMMVTTTPRPIRARKQLIAAPDTVVTNAKTWENVGNVAADFLAALRARWTGDARHRQEILGELIEDVDGALWRRADIEAARGSADGVFARVVVAVDPPATSGANADACGIIAAAARGEGLAREAFVLADASVRGARPNEWAGRVAALVERVGADYVVAESNNGGEMVRAVLAAAGIKVGVQLVHASIGKRARAEPIAALYAQRRVKHVAAFAELEDEMCAFGVESGGKSPDRVDALVWALTDLMLHARGGPRARML